MDAVGLSNGTAAAAFSAMKDVVVGEDMWLTAAVGAAFTVSTSLWMYGVLQRAHKSAGPVIWPVFGSLLEMRRNFHRINDWYLEYFNEKVKTWSLRLPYPFNQTFIATVDPVIVEYILTNIQKYGKVLSLLNC